MKRLIYSFLILFIVVYTFQASGPPNAEEVGLAPVDYSLEPGESRIPNKYGMDLLKYIFGNTIITNLDYTPWHDSQNKIRQVRVGGAVNKKVFMESITKLKLNIIKTPIHYAKAMHAHPNSFICYEGKIKTFPAHVIWLKNFDEFMIVIEVPKA